ncbi:hypothetical protein CQ12_01595 [Bradyrhizobium jicamae]|uniref:Uncharacterized protein n=1 Tax=Bradyrhizobium jicamae TaxID=280332 RepID=A0A0R3KP54_9BRAD|nr:hypothetical protein [Bradyrhizobium jicamae]KRQ97408.1 hypothetical protein CQ12_01595 [Bradyrhizobium jicamae]
MSAAAIDLLRREIANPDTQWSLGTFGAIAEFSRDQGEPVRLFQSHEAVSAVTSRGGIALKPLAGTRAFASEGITKTGWNQRIALVLPADHCAMNRRTVLTEIGADREALRAEDRQSILFDLGLGALQADFCVRIADHDLTARLRELTGRAVFAADNPAMALILADNPHRVFISRIGRIEVYQPIPPPSGKSPEGPHTHVLPKLLNSGRTHPATEPVPEDFVPCAHLYPAHPARDALGEPRLFDAARYRAFQRMMAVYGDPEALSVKRRVTEAVIAGDPPSVVADGRHGRTNIRIALRQLKAQGQASAALNAWLTDFDSGNADAGDDEAELPGHD